MKKKNNMKRVVKTGLYTICAISLIGCGGSKKNKAIDVVPQSGDSVSSEEWSVEDHIEYIKNKKAEWQTFIETFDQTYTYAAYVQIPEYDGYEDGLVTIVNDKVVRHFSYYSSSQKWRPLEEHLLIDEIFDRAIAYQEKLKSKGYQDHCWSEYKIDNKKKYLSHVSFQCDGYMPEEDVEIIEISEVNF